MKYAYANKKRICKYKNAYANKKSVCTYKMHMHFVFAYAYFTAYAGYAMSQPYLSSIEEEIDALIVAVKPLLNQIQVRSQIV